MYFLESLQCVHCLLHAGQFVSLGRCSVCTACSTQDNLFLGAVAVCALLAPRRTICFLEPLQCVHSRLHAGQFVSWGRCSVCTAGSTQDNLFLRAVAVCALPAPRRTICFLGPLQCVHCLLHAGQFAFRDFSVFVRSK